MTAELQTKVISADALVQEVTNYRRNGFRLVQIGATRLPDAVELTYSFDKENHLEHLRVNLCATDARISSITPVYWCAFLYENELHDLFKVEVDGLSVDFHGNLYKTAVKFPFGSTKPPILKASTTTTLRPTGQAAEGNGAAKPPTPTPPPNASGSPVTPPPPAQTN